MKWSIIWAVGGKWSRRLERISKMFAKVTVYLTNDELEKLSKMALEASTGRDIRANPYDANAMATQIVSEFLTGR